MLENVALCEYASGVGYAKLGILLGVMAGVGASAGCGGGTREARDDADATGGSSANAGTGGNGADPSTGGEGGTTGGSSQGGTTSGGTTGTGASDTGGTTTAGGSDTGGTTTAGGSDSGGQGQTGGASAGAAGETNSGGTPTGGISSTGGVTAGTGASAGAAGMGTGGTPTGAWLDVDPAFMDFGTVILGSRAISTFTLTNLGSEVSGAPSLTTDYGGHTVPTPDPVALAGCTEPLPAGDSCEFTITVTPPELGLFQTFVRITAEPGTERFGASRLSLHVVGRASGFEVSPPAHLDLGDVAPNVAVPHTFTITATTAISDLELWTVGDELSIDESVTTCTSSLAAGASCTVGVQFMASTLGWKEGMIGVRAGGSSGEMSAVTFTANVTSASYLVVEPAVPPTFVAFFEETTDPIDFTVTNTGDGASGAITATLVGEASADFAILDSDCESLASQVSCTVSVVCSPPMSASAALREAVLSISDGTSHVAVPLTAEVTFRM